MMPVVSLACANKSVWIKVVGRGNFQCSPCLKRIVQEQLAQGCYHYVVDLMECEQLDSTFMGTLTGMAQCLKSQKEGSFKVVNVSDNNREQMEGLGLDQLFLICPLAAGKELPPAGSENTFSQVPFSNAVSKTSVEEAVRSAHEALVTANQDNASKFQSLLEMM